MSADYGTEHFKGYHHDDYVTIYHRGNPDDWFNSTDYHFVDLSEEDFQEIQEIVKQWRECGMQ